MGSYSEFRIAAYNLIPSKSEVVPVLMTMFRESDKTVIPEREDEGGDLIPVECRYVTSVKIAKQRLGVMGFSLGKTQQDFAAEKADAIKNIEEDIDGHRGWGTDASEPHPDDAVPHLIEQDQRRLEILESLGFSEFVSAFQYIKSRPDLQVPVARSKIPPDATPAVRYVLRNEYEDFFLNYPCSDIRYLVRAFLEGCDDTDEVVQDLSELVAGGYYDADDRVADNAVQALLSEFPISGSIVVLTEGSTDTQALERSLRLLYPQLGGYYTFMDFLGSNAQGSAGSLVSTVKAFVGARITNRVVALFDNDAAAEDALRGLSRTSMPPNIRVLQYPNLDLAATYPTIGPSGVITTMDVNGRACSLELYFGTDVLTNDGALVPVQWTGYKEAIGKYQGEVSRKRRLQDLYVEKLRRCEENPEHLENVDFFAMKQLLESLFAVYQ